MHLFVVMFCFNKVTTQTPETLLKQDSNKDPCLQIFEFLQNSIFEEQ